MQSLPFWSGTSALLVSLQKKTTTVSSRLDPCFPSGGSASFRGLEIPTLCCHCTSGPLWPHSVGFPFSKWLLAISRGICIQNWETSEIFLQSSASYFGSSNSFPPSFSHIKTWSISGLHFLKPEKFAFSYLIKPAICFFIYLLIMLLFSFIL